MATTPKRPARRHPPIKSRRGAAIAALLTLLAGCTDAGGPGGHCVMREAAALPVLTHRGQPVVRAAINGQPVAFIVDTGAPSSIVTLQVADQLGLPVDQDHHTFLGGTGGTVMVNEAEISRLGLGHAEAHHVEFWRVDDNFGTVDGLPVAGLFGADFLANYDVLFDLPESRISLFQGSGCGGDIRPPLPDPTFALPFEVDGGNHIRIPVAVDGHRIDAILDSGASSTTLNLDDAETAGVGRADLAGDPRSVGIGIDGRHVPAFLHEFRSLAIGDETRAPARLRVGDIVTPTLVGDDFFRRNQVWISYPHNTAFVHAVGPVTVLPAVPAPAAPPAS